MPPTDLEPEEGRWNPKQSKAVLKELRERQMELLKTGLERKVIHGVHARQAQREEVDQRATFQWLKEGMLDAETEGTIVAAQDGVTHTREYERRVLKRETPRWCRVCEKGKETLGHILTACPGHQWTLIKERHDRVLYLLTKAVLESLKIAVPKSMKSGGGRARVGVIGPESKRVQIDQLIPTIRKIENTRPDMVVRVDALKRIAIFDIACAWDKIVGEREREKCAKYQELAADLARQRKGYKVTVVAVVLGDLGIVQDLRRQLRRSGVLTEKAIWEFMRHAQREVLCAAVKIIKRHMSFE